jgi:hypothetical protein
MMNYVPMLSFPQEKRDGNSSSRKIPDKPE